MASDTKDKSISVFFCKEGMAHAERINLTGKKIGHRVDKETGHYHVFADNQTAIVKNADFMALLLDTDATEPELK